MQVKNNDVVVYLPNRSNETSLMGLMALKLNLID